MAAATKDSPADGRGVPHHSLYAVQRLTANQHGLIDELDQAMLAMLASCLGRVVAHTLDQGQPQWPVAAL